MPRLSIIVPVYNVKDYLGECIESILAQQYQDFELICVNDGSTDDSLKVLEHYAENDYRIQIISKKNGGLVSARKAGLSQAKGEYAAFVDADDWVDRDMYHFLMEIVMKERADVVTSGCILEYSSGSIVELEQMDEGSYEGRSLKEDFYPKMIGMEQFFQQNISIHVWNKIYKTSLLRKNIDKIPDSITVGEDAACVYPTLLDVKKIVVTHKAFYHYRMRETSMMGKSRQYINSYITLYDYLKKRFEEYPYSFLEYQLKLLTAYELLLVSPVILWEKENAILPYADLKKGSRVVLYGMGRFGKLLKKELEENNLCSVVATVDQNRKRNSFGEKCYSLEEFARMDMQYDAILISILKRNICEEIKEKMLSLGISDDKIKEPDAETICRCEFSLET